MSLMCVLQDWSWTFSWRWRRRQDTVLDFGLARECGKLGKEDVDDIEDVDGPVEELQHIFSGVISSSIDELLEKSGLGSESLHSERLGASSGCNVCRENASTISVIGAFGPAGGKYDVGAGDLRGNEQSVGDAMMSSGSR